MDMHKGQLLIICDWFTNFALIVLFVGVFITHGTGNIGTVLCLLALIGQVYTRKVFFGKDEKQLLLVYCLWAGAVLFSTFYGVEPMRWISRWANLYVWCFIAFPLMMFLPRREEGNKKSLIAGLLILTVLCGMLAYQGIVYHQRAGSIINTGIMTIGSVLSVTLPSMFICFLDERIFGKYRWFVFLAFVICNMGLLYNQTRGAWLACGLMYIVAAVLYFRRDIKITAIVLAMGFVAGLLVCGNSYISSRWTLDPNHSSNIMRVRTWTSAYQIWKDNPILGSGYRTFEKLYQNQYISPKASEEEKRLTHAHNNYLMVLAEQGIVGEIFFLFCYGTMLLYGIGEYYRFKDPYSLMITAIVAGTLIHGCTECNLDNPFFLRIYWTILGWAIYSHNSWKGKVNR